MSGESSDGENLTNFENMNDTNPGIIGNNPATMPQPLILTIIETLCYTSCVVGAILGNFLVLITFLKYRKTLLRSPTHYFLANLSLADFCVGVFVLPFLAWFTVTQSWPFGNDFCYAWTILHFWFCSASILATLGVCVERFLGVRYPLHYPVLMSKRRVYLGGGAIWVVSLCLSVVPKLVFPNDAPPVEGWCRSNFRLGHVIVSSIGIFHIPASMMVVLYYLIYRSYQASISLRTQKEGSSRIPTATTTGKNENSTSTSKDQFKLARKLTFLVGFLILSYLPMFTLIFFAGFNASAMSPKVFMIIAWVRYFNSCLNPIIYAFSVPGFRKGFNLLIGRDTSKGKGKDGNPKVTETTSTSGIGMETISK